MTDATVLLREPWRAIGRRLVIRLAILFVPLLMAGLPGAWEGPITWLPLQILMWVLAAIGALFVVLSFANLARTRRVLLVRVSSGALERPRSVQEVVLGREPESVDARVVEVTESLANVAGSKADPRVTLSAGEETIRDLPLWGTSIEDFAERVNDQLGPGGPLLRVVPRMPLGDEAEGQ